MIIIVLTRTVTFWDFKKSLLSVKAVFSMVAIKECEEGYPFLTSVLHEVE